MKVEAVTNKAEAPYSTPLDVARQFLAEHDKLTDALEQSETLVEQGRDQYLAARANLAKANADKLHNRYGAAIDSTTDALEVASKALDAARSTRGELRQRIVDTTSAVIEAHGRFTEAFTHERERRTRIARLRDIVGEARSIEAELDLKVLDDVLPALDKLPADNMEEWVETEKLFTTARDAAALRAEVSGAWEAVKPFEMDERAYEPGDVFDAWMFDQPAILRRMAAKGSVKRPGATLPEPPVTGNMVPHNAFAARDVAAAPSSGSTANKPGSTAAPDDLLSGLRRGPQPIEAPGAPAGR